MSNNLYNLNIERSVLASIIFEPSSFEDIAAKIVSQDFYLLFHRELFSVLSDLLGKEIAFDDTLLKDVLKSDSRFDDASLEEIYQLDPIVNIDAYLDQIKSRSMKRELVELATTIRKATIEDDLPVDETMDIIERKLYEITQNSMNIDFKDAEEITMSLLDNIRELKSLDNSGLIGVDTGFKNINDKTSGFGKGDLVIIAARPAMGKCLGKGTNVLMHSGELEKVENIKVGDLLMGDDSTPRKVLSLARGREEMYWVRQNDGIDYRVNKSHILSLKSSTDEAEHKSGDVLNISVDDYLKKSDRFKNNFSGYKVAIDFPEKDLDIEPYSLGLWLGDETLTENISLETRNIPQVYLSNSRENRLELLAGLIDSAGYYSDKHYLMEIVEKPKKLSEQTKFLADSLGFRCSLKAKIENRLYNIRITGHLDAIPVRLEANKARPMLPTAKHLLQTDIKVEFDKVDDYYGFEIDGNRLFLLEDMTVTHNTSLVLNMTQKAIYRGEGVAFFSLEMPAEQLMMRLLSTITSIPLQKLRIGDLDDDEWKRLTLETEKMSKKKLFVDDGGYATIHQIRSKLRKLKAKHPEISMAVIDYLQLMSGESKDGRQMVISEISRGLKQLARELQIPILALSQLNRGVESRDNKRPMLSDLRESGCLAGDSMIIDANSGKRYRIDELVENKNLLPLKTKAMDESLNVRDFTITNAFFSGEKLLYRLRTKSGKTIDATANHKFYREDGWTRLDNLTTRDKIATPKSMNIDSKNSILSNSELSLLAHLLEDGLILKGEDFIYSSSEIEAIEIVKDRVKELFDIDAKLEEKDGVYTLHLISPYSLVDGKKHPIALWFEKLNIDVAKSHNKKIPEDVFEADEASIELFLKHLWVADGSITESKSGDTKVYYITTSEILATQIKSLLLRVGVMSTVRKLEQIDSDMKYRDSFHILIRDKVNVQKFLKRVGGFGKSKESSDLYLKALDDETIEDLSTSDIYWDKIVSIEKLGVDRTYDLTVDTVHNFVANDIIVHNSIEQDADIVMFVYRDDVYREAAEKEKEMRAKANGEHYENKFRRKEEEAVELILGKHRNGPIGTIDLVFQKKFTRFVDAQMGGNAGFETIYEGIDTSTNSNIQIFDMTHPI
jgi:replicative DNA helicase